MLNIAGNVSYFSNIISQFRNLLCIQIVV